jgi:tRNA A-37 threonylcarbamoyl transferase component Bud32
MSRIGSYQVFKKGNVVTKKNMPLSKYLNELIIYSKKLSYTPKLISKDDNKRQITISYECCEPLTKLSKKEQQKYYPDLKKLYYKFKKDTGYYHDDFASKNLIVNKKTGKITLIDFGLIVTNKKDRNMKRQGSLLKDLGLL